MVVLDETGIVAPYDRIFKHLVVYLFPEYLEVYNHLEVSPR